MFGFGNKKRDFQGRVLALLPAVGFVEGDAGILHIHSLIDQAYEDGLNEYETALKFIFTNTENLATTERRTEVPSLYNHAVKTQAEWAKSGAVRPHINAQMNSLHPHSAAARLSESNSTIRDTTSKATPQSNAEKSKDMAEGLSRCPIIEFF